MADFDLTVEYVEKLHRLAKAEAGVHYPCEDGNIYLGTTSGNLLLLQKAGDTIITTIININGDNVQSALEQLNGRLFKVERTYVTKDALAAAEQRARCMAISMSIIL